jgi:hypothetical protein
MVIRKMRPAFLSVNDVSDFQRQGYFFAIYNRPQQLKESSSALWRLKLIYITCADAVCTS